MYKIGDFSKINRITVKALRLYDELGLLKPICIDKQTGYRLYDTNQILLVQKIISLKQIGMSLNEIKDLIGEDVNSDRLIKKLSNKISQINQVLEVEKTKLLKLRTYINTLRKDKIMNYHVTIKDLPEVIVASVRKIIANYDELYTIAPYYGNLLIKQKIELRKPEYCFNIYHDKEYKENNIDIEVCNSVTSYGKDEEGMTFKKIPGIPQAACIIHKGPYENLRHTYAFLTKWINDNGYEISDNMREVYYDGCWNKDDPNDWVTEIQAPVIRKK